MTTHNAGPRASEPTNNPNPDTAPVQQEPQSTAEILGEFRRGLISQGFDAGQAFTLVQIAHERVLNHNPVIAFRPDAGTEGGAQ